MRSILPSTLGLLLATAGAHAETIVVPVPSPYSYDSSSMRQLALNGSTGRYIGFTGHTVIEWPAEPARLNPGSPGSVQCRNQSCWLQGYIAPSLTGGTPAGSMRSFFRYELDCQDRSFNRIGDVRIPRPVAKGWQPVEYDPTALAVANSWCPRIQELPPASAWQAVQSWMHPN